jgi:hypothetical protein
MNVLLIWQVMNCEYDMFTAECKGWLIENPSNDELSVLKGAAKEFADPDLCWQHGPNTKKLAGWLNHHKYKRAVDLSEPVTGIDMVIFSGFDCT